MHTVTYTVYKIMGELGRNINHTDTHTPGSFSHLKMFSMGARETAQQIRVLVSSSDKSVEFPEPKWQLTTVCSCSSSPYPCTRVSRAMNETLSGFEQVSLSAVSCTNEQLRRHQSGNPCMSMANTANQAPYYQSPGSALACSTATMKGFTKGYDLVIFWDFRGSCLSRCNRHDLKETPFKPTFKKEKHNTDLPRHCQDEQCTSWEENHES